LREWKSFQFLPERVSAERHCQAVHSKTLVAVTATAWLKLLNTTITYAWTTMAVSGWAQERATAVCLLPENALGKVLAACNAILSFVTALYFSIAASLVWYTNTLCI